MTSSRFERMMALPEEEYRHLKNLQQTTGNPLQTKMTALSNEYHKQNFIPDPQVQVEKQGETLKDMLHIKEELQRRLVSMTPKAYQSRAKSLFRFVENKMKINERGEVTDKDDTVIAGSNIGDLVQHAVRDRRRNFMPTGWEYFLNVLRDNNAPRMNLNYQTLEELDKGIKPLTPPTSPAYRAARSVAKTPAIGRIPAIRKRTKTPVTRRRASSSSPVRRERNLPKKLKESYLYDKRYRQFK